MPIINGVPTVNPNVQYEGYVLPRDKAPLAEPPVDPDVNYAGYELPAQKATLYTPVVSSANNPAELAIGKISFIPKKAVIDPIIILPNGIGTIIATAGIQISPKNDKIIAESQIIDGVSVFEHINRKPIEFDIEILLWENGLGAAFPQQMITTIWDNLWAPNTVQEVRNTFINGLHVNQLIMRSISPTPRLGSTNVVLRIRAVENQPGHTIIL